MMPMRRITSPRNSATGRLACVAEVGEFVAELLQPGDAVLGQALDLVEMLQGLGEQERRVLVVATFLSPLVVLALGPPGDQREVLEPHPVAGAHEDARERHAGHRVVGGAGVRQHLHHLGQAQQPGQAHDLDRDVPFGEGLLQQEEQPRRAAQHGDLRPPGAVVVQRHDAIGHPLRLGELVAVRGHGDLALAVRRERHEPLLGVGALVRRQRSDDGVGRAEDAGAAAEVREQRKPGAPASRRCTRTPWGSPAGSTRRRRATRRCSGRGHRRR